MTALLTKPLMTTAEFLKLPDPTDGSKLELYQGKVVTVPPPQSEHGMICLRIGWILMNHVEPKKLGWIMSNDTGVMLSEAEGTLLAPDLAYWSRTRVPERPRGYLTIVPDLAIEVLSPSDRRSQVREKIRLYIEHGVPLVWLVDPEARTVTVYSGNLRGVEYDETDTIDGGSVLSGFECRLSELFQ